MAGDERFSENTKASLLYWIHRRFAYLLDHVSTSQYFDYRRYKGFTSVILFGVADSNRRFLWAETGHQEYLVTHGFILDLYVKPKFIMR